MRDVFVNAFHDPLSLIMRTPNRLEVIRDLDLKVYEGDRIALVGVNGVGKTTLCRTVAGYYTPTAGKISLRGKVRAIFDTMVGIYPELTGRENAGILVDFLYPDIQDKEEKIRDALEFTELGKFLDTPFKFYSNGMQARLCLAVLTMDPTDLLILDEVFEGADQFFREKIAKRVLSIIERSGAVIFVSHSEDQLQRVCNRAVLISEGRVLFDGSVKDTLRAYEQTHGRKTN
jgi:ABC-type polysaccharide/polyol phosphate transport system ATPase subunit